MENSESDELSEELSESSEDVVLNINPVKFFEPKELCYYKKINTFYSNCSSEQIEMMIDIIKSGAKNKAATKSKISLRVLDWFVTKYSKKVDLSIDTGTNDIEIFDVRMSYKAQLKSLKKRCFDPFRRSGKKSGKFLYHFPNSDYSIETTLGQLNFFKWAFSYGVLTYVGDNLKQISKEMNLSNKEEKQKKKNSEESSIMSSEKKPKHKKKLDKDIRIRAIKTIDCDDVQIVLKFD
jgi:hypothetical protein